MYKLYTENMPYPDLSITLVKSVKSLRCTWVVAATLIALPEYYQNRFRLSWLNITQKGILKKGRFPESLFLSLPPRRSPESRRKVNDSCGVGLVSLVAVFWMSFFGFKRLTAKEGHSTKIVIRVCASQRGNDFEAPDLERGYTYFFPS